MRIPPPPRFPCCTQVLQQAVSYQRYDKHMREYDGGVHRVSWGFLRLAGPQGAPLLGKLKLQLYEFKNGGGWQQSVF